MGFDYERAGQGWLAHVRQLRRDMDQPTEEEKAVHRAIGCTEGDGKRFGHGQFIGDDE
jgi:hypothetical protein